MLTGIIDVAHWEEAIIPHLAEAKAKGLLAVIAKATQGKDAIDRSFPKFAVECKRLGLLFASYHFGSGTTDGATQADWFLRHADPDSLMCLDFEWQTKDKKTGKPRFPEMTVAQAEQFVVRIHEKTGRWPLVYTSRSWVNECKPKPAANSPLANCPLWLCWYLDASPDKHLPVSPWKQCDLHQYTNGHDGPHDEAKYPRVTPANGEGWRVDRSAFFGDEAALREWWANCGRERGPACRST